MNEEQREAYEFYRNEYANYELGYRWQRVATPYVLTPQQAAKARREARQGAKEFRQSPPQPTPTPQVQNTAKYPNIAQAHFDKAMADYAAVRDNPDLPNRGWHLQNIGRARINLAKARGETDLLEHLTGTRDRWPYDHTEKHRQAALKGHRK